MTAPSKSTETLVRAVIDNVKRNFPVDIPTSISDASQAFALAGLARMVDLLDAELQLYLGEKWAVTRVLGRALREVWLFTMFTCLAPEEAMDQLDRTDARHRDLMNKGIETVNEILREWGTEELSMWAKENEDESSRFKVAQMAKRVDELLTEQGRKAGMAITNFELFYRLESGDDVHPSTYDFFFRYLEPSEDRLRVLATPQPDGYRVPYPDEELKSDALAVADAVRYVAAVANLPRLFTDVAGALEEQARIRLLPLDSVDS